MNDIFRWVILCGLKIKILTTNSLNVKVTGVNNSIFLNTYKKNVHYVKKLRTPHFENYLTSNTLYHFFCLFLEKSK